MPVAVARASNISLEGEKQRVLEVLLTTINDYDAYTGGHSARVARYSAHVARLLGLSFATMELVRRAAFVHDIGKILIPDTIVQKRGRLTDDERAIVEMHSELGARMLARRPVMRDLAPIVLHHHERWDGDGYPHGLAGSAIPIESRIIFVADAFDAMTSERPYGRVLTPQEAGAELRRCSGKDFDPQVVRAMRLALNSGGVRRSHAQVFSPAAEASE
ncbi:MAG: HD-GYP domain-containing protein [Actinomycetota bacterium]|nr:HD-GYP domain-containing protein [Actinomycetota bacterium]